MRMSCFRFLVLAAPILLAGCGEGWEVQRTDKITPYGNKRTAGTGVVYVRAKMLPEKEIVAEPQGYEEIKSGDEVFSRAQTKGAPKSVPHEEDKALKQDEEVKKDDTKEVKPKAEVQKDVKHAVTEDKVKVKDSKVSEEKSAVAPAAGEVIGSGERAKAPPKKKSYEQMLDEGHSKIEPYVKPEKVEPKAGIAEPEKQSSLISAPGGDASVDIVQVPEEIKIDARTNKSVIPVNQIRSPMMDVYNREIDAERSLEEIYSNPF